MAFVPAHSDIHTVELPLSTVSVTRGSVLTLSDAGYLSSTAITSAAPVSFIAAETKNGAATGRSALASTTADDDHKILAWPTAPGNRFYAACSSTPTTAMLDVAWNVNDGSVQNETSAEGMFLIENIVDATNKKVVGRFASGWYSGRGTIVANG